MRSKLTFVAMAAALLFGATAFAPAASAQAEPGAGASAPMASVHHHHHHHYYHHHHYSRRRMDKDRPGGRPVSRKAPS